ncbi:MULTISPECIES: class I SAM-dependent methyltransferase [Nitrospirillum]|uniref:Methyltransferase family protein n=1 Tax=Nitrospirillum amazonense TaxID=28077 RepID=A0A560FMT7_9PROT|nr:class I SAM-dependent methyltransferase [Nitrospirillum amazonense]MEC4591676.1 class I SAM-dependent methyltransferase [Nitrospirillum amazonense]TWB22934.1 methyltransferase family protein [Nitrospirillum amazonense]
MDQRTLAAYDTAAGAYAEDWHSQPAPSDLHDLIRRHFAPGQPTVDIGCGSGREVAWLAANGYPAVGYDASEGLLAQARARYPGLDFGAARLPDLAGLPDRGYANVLCETVIMHLDTALIDAAVRRLASLVRPGGTLYLSWRVTRGTDARDGAGRLYAAFDSHLVRDALAGASLLLDEEATSASSGKTIHRLVARF